MVKIGASCRICSQIRKVLSDRRDGCVCIQFLSSQAVMTGSDCSDSLAQKRGTG